MRIFSRHVALAGLLAAIAACGGAGDADETRASGTPDPVDTELRPEFAVALDIDLDEMQRSSTGLYTRDVVEGTGLAARDGYVVMVHYTGWLPTGDVFDSNVEGDEPYSFQLGRRSVIAGWEEGVQGMRIGGKRILVIPPSLAYGARGRPGAIPPNAHLVFEIELLDIKM